MNIATIGLAAGSTIGVAGITWGAFADNANDHAGGSDGAWEHAIRNLYLGSLGVGVVALAIHLKHPGSNVSQLLGNAFLGALGGTTVAGCIAPIFDRGLNGGNPPVMLM